MVSRRLAVLLVAWVAVAAPGPAATRLPAAATRAVAADDLRTYVATLASDGFNGRGVGDAGNRAAEAADDTDRIDFGKLTPVARLAARAAWIVADGAEPALKKR